MATAIAAATIACVRAVPISVDSEEHDRPPPPAPIAEAPLPQCPAGLDQTAPLETALGASIRPGAWHADSQASTLGFAGSWRERFRGQLALAKEPVEVAGLNTPSIVSIVFSVPGLGHNGACILNAWSAYFPGNVEGVALEDRWLSPDRSTAVLLLKLRFAHQEVPTWMALATDGARVWFALDEGGRRLLPVKSAALHPSNPRLYLDVTQNQTTRFVLRDSGRFERIVSK